MLSEGPQEWLNECQGQTNYVLALDEAARWTAATHPGEPVLCVTFNYDTLLEAACQSVYGRSFNTINEYAAGEGVRLYKPHGSVNWRQAARWGQPINTWYMGPQALDIAINSAADLEWRQEFRVQVDDQYQDSGGMDSVWLPAVSVPARSKATFTMPDTHQQQLKADLGGVSTVIAVGWRARERHFLRLLQDHLPSTPARLVAVAESEASAMETVDHLWETGRFDRYTTSVHGFSKFTTRLQTVGDQISPTLRLSDVLTGSFEAQWVARRPGSGLVEESEETPLGMSRGYSSEL